ncbi:MAG: tRNA-dihydrouridine synthase family protein [Gammaproteobacteria bacterium]|nr:tRNA-dihydrouridine synthase family protein [Gammaproteobacteria bacterium]
MFQKNQNTWIVILHLYTTRLDQNNSKGFIMLALGKTTFPVNIIQGPLAGVSCAPFRKLTWRYSKPAFSCTEMISCKTLLYQSAFSQKRFTKIDPEEGPVCFQLAGNNPQELAEATKIVTTLGANLIDLNCGCPVKKIRRKGAGSSLLANTSLLYQLIKAMKDNTHVPISIKIRIDGNSDDAFNRNIATVIEDAGANFLVVHGRHWTENYETPCHYSDIAFFVNELNIPVIGNGDISCLTSLKKMLATGCAGVMISRAGVGQPWLIRQLIEEMQENIFLLPSNKEIGSIFVEHVTELAELLGNEMFAIIQARKLAKYYARRLETKTLFCTMINNCKNLPDLINICMQHFEI